MGNLVSRCTAPSVLVPSSFARAPAPSSLTDEDNLFLREIRQLPYLVRPYYRDTGEIGKAADSALTLLRSANKYFNDHEPWTLRRRITERREEEGESGPGGGEGRVRAHQDDDDADDELKLEKVLYLTMEAVRVSAIVLWPIMPVGMERVLRHLAVLDDDQNEQVRVEGEQGSCGRGSPERQRASPLVLDPGPRAAPAQYGGWKRLTKAEASFILYKKERRRPSEQGRVGGALRSKKRTK